MLLDEDSQAKYLVNLLQAAGHDVVTLRVRHFAIVTGTAKTASGLTVNAVGLMNRPDSVILNHAQQDKRVILTRNCDDFQELHQANPIHSGILAVYQNSDAAKNMSYRLIVKAIANLEAAEYILNNRFVILNQWNY